jgi:hypothetical protein
MKRTHAFRYLLVILSALALIPPGAVLADGPGGGRKIRLDNEPAGPYRLRVTTSPAPPRVDNLYLEIRVMDRASGRIVTDAQVQVIAVHQEGLGSQISAPAVHDIAPIPDEYAVHLAVDAPGVWQITVQVQGPAGRGEVKFLERVAGQSSLAPLLSIGVPAAGLGALVAAFLWLQRRSTSQAPQEGR